MAEARSDPTTRARRIVQLLREEAEVFWDREPHIASTVADCMIAIAEQFGLEDLVALGEMTRGDTQRILADYDAAIHWLTAAGERFRKLDDAVGWARTRTGLILALHEHGDPTAELDAVPEARRILERHRQWL